MNAPHRPRVLLPTQVLPYPPDSDAKIKTWNLIQYLASRYDLTLASFVGGDETAGAGTRVKILTAVAHALPVVSTRIGCEGLAIVPGEHLLVGDTRAELANAVARVLSDPDLAARLGTTGRQLIARRYDYRQTGRAVDDLYARMLGSVAGGNGVRAVGERGEAPRSGL